VPFGIYLDAGDRTLLGRSMERFLAWSRASARLETRPIKGTVAAENTPETRADAGQRLRADPKEHAEHTMVVDLMRNDLGKLAVPGTVVVEDAFVVEPFARLSHLVSTISCTTRAGLGITDVLEATFPPGSVTGTPKRRAIELIEALERDSRGIYCGAYGCLARNGDLSLAVAIRSAVIHDGSLEYHAGGGIVSASDPARETAETELKTRVLRDAFEALDARDMNDGRPKPW
jgi:anthranilate/para-aminobenzoate synthase component I